MEPKPAAVDFASLTFREMAPEDADAVEIVEKACSDALACFTCKKSGSPSSTPSQ